MAHLQAQYTKALLRRLGYAEQSHCPEHKWASARQVPGRKSIFSPLTKQGEPAKEDADAQRNASESQLESEKLALRMQSVLDYVSNCGLSTSKEMEALDLQGFPRAGSGLSRTSHLSRDEATEASQGQYQSPPTGTFLETEGLNVEGASLGGAGAQERGPKEGPLEPQLVAQGREDNVGVIITPSEPIADSVNIARKSLSTSKVNSKGALVGAKRNKKGKARTQKGNQHPNGPPSADAGVSNLTKGESMNKANLKQSPRMNHQEEKKPEEPSGSGPFFYIGGANGFDIVNVYCENKGWQRIYDNRRVDYTLKWCETKHREDYCNFREGQQLLYQIPNNRVLTTKIGLLVNLREYERVMMKISKNGKLLKMEDFFPETFRLDMKDEREVFFEIYREPHIWICKPTCLNQGRGIFLLKNQEQVKRFQLELQNVVDDPAYRKVPHRSPGARILQRYIDRPLLIEGKKFDVRSYLLIACTVPYMLFFGHGYARLTCLNYNPMSDDITSHLTNQCVQKKNPIYNNVKEETVWRMERFNAYVNERFRHIKGLPKDWVLNNFTRRMKEIMLHCFLAVKSKLECKLGYFDLIGCDFLIDEEFKVWLLEMNSNPALHTNCGTLKSIIPTVVNETLDLAIEIFTKSQKSQPIFPLESPCHFVLIYNGVASDNRVPRPTKSRTSLHSLHSPREGNANATSAPSSSSSSGTSSSRVVDKQPPKPLEKLPKMEPPGPPDVISLLPNKAATRDILPVPQIQISIVPDLANCPSVKAVLRAKEVCSHGNQYIIKNVPESDGPHTGSCKAHSSDNKAKNNPTVAVATASKDRSYSSWLQQTFATKYSSSGGNLASMPLTSSQMVSLHLQSNIPPNIPVIQEHASLPYQPVTQAKPPMDSKKAVARTSSCNDSLPEDTKASHRGS
ncbi:inactive polyglycylase TTLL10 [Eublepharis macularius]|uniref:Inactive polyglycylase TTLL10 n=1 Tax=Eublepharis macularius TaxID=481883 RepID=A0AA97KJ71_EUBMA|nr:inactive polyglycylase TTLL10 [Eublepharis macularius]